MSRATTADGASCCCCSRDNLQAAETAEAGSTAVASAEHDHCRCILPVSKVSVACKVSLGWAHLADGLAPNLFLIELIKGTLVEIAICCSTMQATGRTRYGWKPSVASQHCTETAELAPACFATSHANET